MIFEDPSRRRWRIAVASFTVLSLAGLVLFSLSAAALITNPKLPGLREKTDRPASLTNALNLIQMTDTVSQPRTETQWQHTTPKVDPTAYQGMTNSASLTQLKGAKPSLRTAFLLQGDANSIRSLRANEQNLDAVFPDWFFLSRSDCTTDQRIQPSVTNELKQSGLTVIARVADGEGGTSYSKQTAAIMHDPTLRDCVAQKIVDETKTNGGKGVLLDLESLAPANADDYVQLLVSFKRALQARGMSLIVSVPSGSQAYPIETVAQIADGVLVILHGEHFAGSAPGPLASQGWFEETLAHFAAIVPKNKLIVGMGSYGMDWAISPTSTAVGLTYGETMSQAQSVKALPQLTTKARNMAFSYEDTQGRPHIVWLLDAASLWNQWQQVKRVQPLGVAVWRLGSEDPNIWTFLGKPNPTVTALTSIPALYGVFSASQSEIYHVIAPPTQGTLAVKQDAQGFITNAAYTTLPTGFVLERVGSAPPKQGLVLAFYGGPDPVWTPKILDLLTSQHVPAVFFVSGREAEKYPDVLQQIASHGFLIGNNGYQDSDIRSLSPDQLRSNVNLTQRLIENATQRHSLLFSAAMPNTPEAVVPIQVVDRLGYVTVSPHVRVNDQPNISANAIASDMMADLDRPEHHLIALHDGGGDRANLVSALGVVIPLLKSKGYQFLPLDKAIDINATDLAPHFGGNEAVFVRVTSLFSGMRNLLWPTLFWLFIITTGFSALRILFMSIYVLRSVRHPNRIKYHNPWRKEVSVLIPAYNEGKTIEKTLSSLQQSTHRKFEALVIDDGSTDDTAAVVKAFAARDPRIKLLQKTNGGKATALNLGMQKATNEIVVTIDADTVLMPETINELILPFADPNVDAVCGNVEVGNVHNLITGFQALEYITAQNFDRRAFEEVNAISVVPGATGAWRRKRVLEIGGYESDTLTEDADLTIKMLAHGGKIVYAPSAKSRTEAPDSLRDLAKQRFRWSYGTFQCLGKYSPYFFKGNVGWVALPNIFIFQIIFPLLAPVGDFVFLLAIMRGDFSMLFFSYLFFTLMDTTGSIFAFLLEHKPKKLMLLVLIQRFFYRQFLYVTIIRAIIAMLQGRRYGWNKLQRTGTVAVATTTTS